jgi:hypothetical protein
MRLVVLSRGSLWATFFGALAGAISAAVVLSHLI